MQVVVVVVVPLEVVAVCMCTPGLTPGCMAAAVAQRQLWGDFLERRGHRQTSKHLPNDPVRGCSHQQSEQRAEQRTGQSENEAAVPPRWV